MTVTYDLTTEIGKVRLSISDNVIADAHFTDEELQYFLVSEGSVNLAAARALESWAAAYAANVDSESMGDYSYTQSIVNKMLASAKQLRQNEADKIAVPTMAWAEMDLLNNARENLT